MKTFSVLFAFLLLGGCQAKAPTNPGTPELLVAAAANLTDVCPEIGQRFTETTGIRVVFSYGATGDLSRQIENGAPFDLLAAADTEHVEQLERKGLLTDGSRAIYARGKLVLWLPSTSPKVTRVEDITSSAFERVAVAKPDVAPYGRATVESLKALNIWQKVESKVVYGQSVAQTKQFAATGNAEAAFIPLALIKTGEGSYLEVDESLHWPIDQALGIVKASTNQEAARSFVNFVQSNEGQAILARRGYSRVTNP